MLKCVKAKGEAHLNKPLQLSSKDLKWIIPVNEMQCVYIFYCACMGVCAYVHLSTKYTDNTCWSKAEDWEVTLWSKAEMLIYIQ